MPPLKGTLASLTKAGAGHALQRAAPQPPSRFATSCPASTDTSCRRQAQGASTRKRHLELEEWANVCTKSEFNREKKVGERAAVGQMEKQRPCGEIVFWRLKTCAAPCQAVQRRSLPSHRSVRAVRDWLEMSLHMTVSAKALYVWGPVMPAP